VVLLDTVPGTLFLKTLDSNRYLAIPVELLEVVPGTDGSIECERLDGFPDNWTNTGMPEKFRYFCMGNALVVGVIEMMGKKLIEMIEEKA